jgi:hypothetical protein
MPERRMCDMSSRRSPLFAKAREVTVALGRQARLERVSLAIHLEVVAVLGERLHEYAYVLSPPHRPVAMLYGRPLAGIHPGVARFRTSPCFRQRTKRGMAVNGLVLNPALAASGSCVASTLWGWTAMKKRTPRNSLVE